MARPYARSAGSSSAAIAASSTALTASPMPTTRGATKRRCSSGSVAANQACWFAPATPEKTPRAAVAATSPTTSTARLAPPAVPITVSTANQRPRVSPSAAAVSVTPRRLPPVRCSSLGTASWAAGPISASEATSVVSPGPRPTVRKRGMLRAVPERASTAPWVSPSTRYVRYDGPANARQSAPRRASPALWRFGRDGPWKRADTSDLAWGIKGSHAVAANRTGCMLQPGHPCPRRTGLSLAEGFPRRASPTTLPSPQPITFAAPRMASQPRTTAAVRPAGWHAACEFGKADASARSNETAAADHSPFGYG